jgi:hypothetical protein
MAHFLVGCVSVTADMKDYPCCKAKRLSMQTGEWLFIDTAQLSEKIRFYMAEKEGIKNPETITISGFDWARQSPEEASYCCCED